MSRRAALTGLIIGVVGVTLVGSAVSFGHRVSHGQTDFLGLYRQAELVRMTGSFVHESSGPYPPSARAVYQFWVRLPPAVAAWMWFVVACGLYLGTGWWFVRAASSLPASDHPLALGGALALTAPWVGSDLAQGNISSLLMFAVVGSWLLASRGRPWLAGFVLSLGIIMKPMPLVGLVYLLIKRRWRAASAAVFFVLLFGFGPTVLLVGWERAIDGWVTWQTQVGRHMSPLNFPWAHPPQIDYQNGSTIASLLRLFRDIRAGSDWRITLYELPTWAFAVLWYTLAGLVTGPVLWWTRRPAGQLTLSRQAVELAAYLVLMLWFSPLLMSYYLGMTLVPVSALLWQAAYARSAGRTDRLTVGLLVAFVAATAHMASPVLRASGGTSFTVLILWAALLVHLARAERRGGYWPAAGGVAGGSTAPASSGSNAS